MELSYDWIGFQDLFYPRARTQLGRGAIGVQTGPLHVIAENDTVVEIFGENEDLSDWIGASLGQLKSQMPNRKLVLFDRKEVDAWMQESLPLPHFYEQIELHREKALGISLEKPTDPKGAKKPAKKKESALEFKQHFLLEAILGWWGKVLPSAYGIFIQVEGQGAQEFLLLVRRGAFDGFHKPDLSYLGAERRKQPAEVTKFLSEKYLVPIQGIFVSASDWTEWLNSPSPWNLVSKSLKAGRTRIYPKRYGMKLLLGSRAYLKL